MSAFVLIYVLLCLAVAIMGRRTLIGPVGVFVVCLIFTPILVLLFLALLGPRYPAGSSGPPARHTRHTERLVYYPEDDPKPR